MKYILLTFGIILILALVLDKFINHRYVANYAAKNEPPNKKDSLSTVSYATQILTNINFWKNNQSKYIVDGSLQFINSFIERENEMVKPLTMAYTHHVSNDSIKKLTPQLLQLLVKSQLMVFKQARTEYANSAAKKLWVEDAEVDLSADTKTIIFTSSVFITHRNVQKVHDGIYETLKAFRFQKAIYRWSEYSESVSYTLFSKKDSDPPLY